MGAMSSQATTQSLWIWRMAFISLTRGKRKRTELGHCGNLYSWTEGDFWLSQGLAQLNAMLLEWHWDLKIRIVWLSRCIIFNLFLLLKTIFSLNIFFDRDSRMKSWHQLTLRRLAPYAISGSHCIANRGILVRKLLPDIFRLNDSCFSPAPCPLIKGHRLNKA